MRARSASWPAPIHTNSATRISIRLTKSPTKPKKQLEFLLGTLKGPFANESRRKRTANQCVAFPAFFTGGVSAVPSAHLFRRCTTPPAALLWEARGIVGWREKIVAPPKDNLLRYSNMINTLMRGARPDAPGLRRRASPSLGSASSSFGCTQFSQAAARLARKSTTGISDVQCISNLASTHDPLEKSRRFNGIPDRWK